jgi:hypothetical protein
LAQRPLIDKLQEATFGDATPMQYVTDKYALRMLLRKAHCFNIDSVTSALIMDFSFAIAKDLEAARHLAIPPFPITWFEIDNIARLDRAKKLIGLTPNAQRTDVCNRVGWLINQTPSGGYCASYVAELDTGMFVAPLSFHWSVNDDICEAAPKIKYIRNGTEITNVTSGFNRIVANICFGLAQVDISTNHATFGGAAFQGSTLTYLDQEANLMRELWGELRHIWGLLIALGTAPVATSEPTKHQGPPIIAKGKPLFPLEHKTLTVHLGKRRTVAKTVETALHGIRKRWHEVRAHTRLLKNGARVPVKSHARGDRALGVITKTYVVEK